MSEKRKPKTTAIILKGGSIQYAERVMNNVLNGGVKYTVKQMAEKFAEYIEWCDNNPFEEERAFASGTIDVKKMRMATLSGFCLYAGISRENFYRYKSGEHGAGTYKELCQSIVETIDEIRGGAAAADLLNAGFVAKLMGLSEKIEQVNYNSVQMTPEQIKAISKQLEDEV